MLTVLETAAQAQWYHDQRENRSPSDLVLAVTPTAAFSCQELSLPYLKLEDYAQYSRRFVEYDTVLEDYLNWEARLDDWAQDSIPEFRANGFKPARAVTFLLQLVFAEVWSAAVNLREFLETTNTKEVSFWSPAITVPWFLQPPISAVNAVLPEVARSLGIQVADLSERAPELRPGTQGSPADTSTRTRLKDSAKGYLRQNSVFNEIEALQKLGPASLLPKLKSGRPRILVSGTGYDLEPLLLELRRRGARITRLKDNTSSLGSQKLPASLSAAVSSKLKRAGLQLLDQPELWQPFERLGVGRISLVGMILQFWWESLVPAIWVYYQQVRQLAVQKRFTAMITIDCGGTTWGGAASQALGNLGVPRFVLQHGGSTGVDARLWQMYFRGSDGFLVAGAGAAQELEQSRPSYLDDSARLIPIGSSRLDNLRLKNISQNSHTLRAQLQGGDVRPIVLYVPTTFGTYGRAISDIAAYPEVSYLELQQAVLKLWNETPGVRLLYKDFIVANDPNRVMSAFIQKYVPNGTITYQRLTDLMWAVDAIIVDHPITALSEVLLTKKRLVVYMPKPNSSAPQAAELLRKRAIVAETPASFIESVRSFLRSGDFSEMKDPDTQFLRRYCTHTDDGRSAERAADEVLGETSGSATQLAHEITGKC